MLLPVSGSRKKKEAAIAEPEAAVAPKRAAVSKTSSPKPLDCRQGPVESWSRAGRMRSLHLSPPAMTNPLQFRCRQRKNGFFLRSKITPLPSKIYFSLDSAVGLLPGLDLTEMKGDEQRNRGAGGSPGG